MTKITIPQDVALPPRVPEAHTIYAQQARITALERALDEIIMEATSRNHAIDIARRARAEGGE